MGKKNKRHHKAETSQEEGTLILCGQLYINQTSFVRSEDLQLPLALPVALPVLNAVSGDYPAMQINCNAWHATGSGSAQPRAGSGKE